MKLYVVVDSTYQIYEIHRSEAKAIATAKKYADTAWEWDTTTQHRVEVWPDDERIIWTPRHFVCPCGGERIYIEAPKEHPPCPDCGQVMP